ncbi:MAG: TerD domain-containing protein [Methylococcales bacterium]|nr:TerD domain-containing protein [Methylococcales bacterium]
MQPLIRSQKIKLSDLSSKNQLQIGLAISSPSNLTLDISCFGVDDNNKLSDDRYFIFFNQKISPCGSLSSLGGRNGDQEQFYVDLSRLPSTVRKLVFVVTIDGNGVMSQIRDGYLRLLDQTTELARFAFSSSDFKDEKAVMVGEIYFKDVWRFSAVGQGFNGGLSALLKYFGGEEIAMPTTSTVVESTANDDANSVTVNLEKVSGKVQLSKGSKSVVIQKTPEISASISWETGTDYDVYALVYTQDDKQIDVAAFGASNTPVLMNFDHGTVEHMGDVGRGGGSTKTEIIKIRLNDKILAVVPVAYSAQSNGTGSFYHYKVSMLIDNNKGTSVTITANNANKNDTIYTCVPGMIINTSEGVVIKPLEFDSRPGSENRPKLIKGKDGQIEVVMDAGSINNYK